MKKVKLVLGCLSVYLLFLIVLLPANWVSQFLPEKQRLNLSAVSGTIWQGQVQQVTFRGESIENISWKLNPLQLFTGKLVVDLDFGKGLGISGKGELAYGISGLSAKNFFLSIPAGTLVKYLPIPVPVEANGMLDLTIKHATQGTPYCESLDGNLVWGNARASTPMGALVLNDVNLKLGCEKGELTGVVQQSSEQLNLSAKAWLLDGFKYRLEGDITPGQGLPPQIEQALTWLGPKTDSGAILLKFSSE